MVENANYSIVIGSRSVVTWGRGVWQGEREGLWKGHKEKFGGDRYVHALTVVITLHIPTFLESFAFSMCNLHQLYLNKSVCKTLKVKICATKLNFLVMFSPNWTSYFCQRIRGFIIQMLFGTEQINSGLKQGASCNDRAGWCYKKAQSPWSLWVEAGYHLNLFQQSVYCTKWNCLRRVFFSFWKLI